MDMALYSIVPLGFCFGRRTGIRDGMEINNKSREQISQVALCIEEIQTLVQDSSALRSLLNLLYPSGNYMYRLILQLITLHYILTGFCMFLAVNRDYYLKQH
jgi:hypothetical protein